jgi:hypothetical protein
LRLAPKRCPLLVPLGITIIGGMVFSQLLTLYTTPVVYLVMEKVRAGFAGQRLTAKKIANQWSCFIANALGDERAKQLRIHSGRRSFISHALAKGRGLAEVRDAVGHSNVATTNLYLYALDGGVADLFAELDMEEAEDGEG